MYIFPTWSHIKAVLGEKTENGRNWYLKEAAQQMWSVKTLERNVDSQYYHRLLSSPQREKVEDEMSKLTSAEEFCRFPRNSISNHPW